VCAQKIPKYNIYYNDVWENGGITPPFLSSAQDVGEWSASRPGRFAPWERAPCTHCIGGSVGPRTGLDGR
jgi:hypothetical protein